jgi:sugar phosphate isomerase/epimerase
MQSQLGMVIARPENFRLIDRFGLHRAEFVVFPPEERENLPQEIRKRGLRISVHCPLFRDPAFGENPLLAGLADADDARRGRALDLMRISLQEARALDAEYVVVHVQRPMRFSGDDPDAVTDAILVEAALDACGRLDEISREAGVPVLLENLMDNPRFCRAESYLALFERFPAFGFCLDVGHLDVDARAFDIDFEAFVRALAPHTRAVHLQNSNGGSESREGRYWKQPVHPSQRPEGGWRDIPWILDTVLDHNPGCVINFESVPKDINYAEEGVRWVRGLLDARTSRTF